MRGKTGAIVSVWCLAVLVGCVSTGFRQALVSPDPVTRQDAVAGMKSIKNHGLYLSTLRKLEEYTRYPQPETRIRAAKSIGELGPRAEGAVPSLREMLDDNVGEVRLEAQRAIALVSGKEPAPVGAGVSPVSPRPEGARPTIAVSSLSAEGVAQGDATIVADWLRGALVSAGTYTVVERGAMQKILSEQAFQQSGCTSQECAVRLGKVLNVGKMVVGSFGKFLDSYVLNVRVVEVESGQVVYSDSAKGKTTDEVEGNIRSLAIRLSGGPVPVALPAPDPAPVPASQGIREGW